MGRQKHTLKGRICTLNFAKPSLPKLCKGSSPTDHIEAGLDLAITGEMESRDVGKSWGTGIGVSLITGTRADSLYSLICYSYGDPQSSTEPGLVWLA